MHDILPGKKVHILIHAMIWIILFFFPSYFLYRDSHNDVNFLWLNYTQTILYFITFYVNYLWLIPFFFFKRQKILYFLVAMILVIAATIMMESVHSSFFKQKFGQGQEFQPRKMMPGQPRMFIPDGMAPGARPAKGWPVYNFILITCLVTGLSLGLRFSDKLVQNEKKRKEAEKEKLNTELAMLKNQINPHFLFNTLNSIYSLALMKSDMTAEAVMKLSDMMRYVIQDVRFEKVPLQTELDYIRYYIELQQLRITDNVSLELKIKGDTEHYMIAPMIIIPFVENAFKYGTTSHEHATILVDILVHKNILDFKVSNQIFAGREKNETFGIGITNTRQRLQLIYPEKHELKLTNNGKVYIVNLKIDLT